jgi:creatinine amidohydrolase/Fe(II)-dependent formamide hydrolase-like protein
LENVFLNALQLIGQAFKKHGLDTNTFVKKHGREFFYLSFAKLIVFHSA